MQHNQLSYKVWKLLGWAVMAVVLAALMLLPLDTLLLQTQFNGAASADTVSPPPQEATPTTRAQTRGRGRIPVFINVNDPDSNITSESAVNPDGTLFIPDPVVVNEANPRVEISNVGAAVSNKARVECGCYLPPTNKVQTQVSMPTAIPLGIPEVSSNGFVMAIAPAQAFNDVPIPVPGGVIDQPIGMVHFDFGVDRRGTIVVPAHPEQTLYIRLESLTDTQLPLPLDQTDAIAGLTADTVATRAVHVFELEIYDEAGTPVSMQNANVMFAMCPDTEYSPESLALLRFNDATQQYNIVPQRYNQYSRSLMGYLSQTSATFVVSSMSGLVPQIDTPTLPGSEMAALVETCPVYHLSSCQAASLPMGARQVPVSLVGNAGTDTIDGFTVEVPASTEQAFSPISVPNGSIEQAVGAINFELTCDASSLLIPTQANDTLQISLEEAPEEIGLGNPVALANLPESLEFKQVLATFNLNIVNTSTGDLVETHDPAFVFRSCLKDESSPETPMLLHYDEATQQYDLPEQYYDAATRCLVAYVSETSPFMIASAIDNTQSDANSSTVAEAPIIPAGISDVSVPTTTSTEATSLPLWPLAAVVAAVVLLALVGVWHTQRQ